MLDYLYFIYIIGWFVIGSGLALKNRLFYSLGAMIILIGGLTTITSGLGGEVNDATTIFGLIHSIIGATLIAGEILREV